jgi:hypothetical protein
LSADCSSEKWPRALVARRIRAVRDPITLVEWITLRISMASAKNGTNCDHAESHSRRIAG